MRPIKVVTGEQIVQYCIADTARLTHFSAVYDVRADVQILFLALVAVSMILSLSLGKVTTDWHRAKLTAK